MTRKQGISLELAEAALTRLDWSDIDALDAAALERELAAHPGCAPGGRGPAQIAAWVRGVRRRLGLSQQAFARRFFIPLPALRDWEAARRMPEAASLAYLRVIARAPQAVAQALAA